MLSWCSNCARLVLKLCSAGAQIVLGWCSNCARLVLKLCSAGAQTVLGWCSNVLFGWCSNCARLVLKLCSAGAQIVLGWCSNCARLVLKLCSAGAQIVLGWCSNCARLVLKLCFSFGFSGARFGRPLDLSLPKLLFSIFSQLFLRSYSLLRSCFFRWHWNSRKELFFATQANWQYAQQGSHAARSWSDKSQYTPASCRRGVEGKQAPRPWHCTSTTEEQPIMKAVGFERGPLSRTPSAGTTCCASAGNPCWADTSPGSGSVTAPISGAISGCTRQGDPT